MRWLRAGFLPVSVMILVAAAFIVPLPLYLERPGSPLSLDDCVAVARPEGAEVAGDYLLTTINVRPGTLVDALVAAVETDTEVVQRSALIPPGVSSGTYFRQQREVFRSTSDVAAAVALQAAGLPADVGGDGARVIAVYEDSPSAGVLQPGDVITAVDGTPVQTDLELREAIVAGAPGEALRLDVQRRGQTIEVDVAPEVIDGRPVIGVAPETANLQVTLPVDVTVSSGRTAGPSAALMIALTVYDKVLQDVDLAAGRLVAGTGTLDHLGHVGPVGGAELKVIAAHRAGADVFVVPEQEVASARAGLPAGSDMQILGVATFDEAREGLASSVPEQPAAPAGDRAPCPHDAPA